ncbi:cupin domain-containing protein [Qipengyuania xiapuensis]|uniref:Cupin domain-containing protein n=1 Tax=Qipengyuania xiapuensis TaxID=2867236 RepID=A0ABX8ZRP2_9SPHN|nr:cupin domain-containing protein [Qipengyuania xiapuensis]QZD91557.1 cupin domain-containing protein [Qipengyuania xiapuensis]
MRNLLTIAAPLAAGAILAAGAQAEDTGEPLPSALEAGWNGERVCELRHQTDTHRVLRCTFPPGVGHERHYHPAHYGYALSGGTMQLTSESGTRTATLETGSDYSSDGTEWHEVVNVGKTTVTYLIVEEL